MALRDDERGILWESESAVRRELRQRIKQVPLIVDPKVRRGYRELRGIEAYKWDDAQCVNLIMAHEGTGVAPYRYLDVTHGDGQVLGDKSVRAAGWSVIYLHALVAENKRPKHWIEQARTKIRELADFLLERQAGTGYTSSDVTGLIGTTATTDAEYGAFIVEEDDETYFATSYSEDVGTCGLALLRAYQLFGEPKYRVGYRAALTCLRRMQQGGKLSTYHAASSSGGGRYHSGMWTHKLRFYDPYAQGGGGGGVGDAHSVVFHMNWRAGAGQVAQVTSNTTNESADPNTGWTVDMDEFDGTRVRYRMFARFQAPASHTKTFRLRVGSSTTFTSNTAVASLVRSPSQDALGELDSGIVTKPSGVVLIQLGMQASSSASGTGQAFSPVLLMEFYV